MSIDRDSFKTLLPKIEPKKQKDLDYLGNDVISRIDLEGLTLLPSDTPANLKHLAYMYDVNIEGLSEKEQRKLIEKSFDIHRHLGTGYALKEALKVVGIESEIVEWYNTDGELSPYNFGLKLNKMDDRGTSFLLNYIERFKNERSRLAKLSDGKCKSKAQYDNDRYEEAVLSDVEGLIINGVRVCFRGSSEKSIALAYSSVRSVVPYVSKISYFFKNRYDNLRYGEKKESFLITSSTLKNIDKKLQLKRIWLGAWVGSVSDGYLPSFSASLSVAKETILEKSVSSLLEVFSNRESILKQKITKQTSIDKSLKLQRQWHGAWVGSVSDGYAVVTI